MTPLFVLLALAAPKAAASTPNLPALPEKAAVFVIAKDEASRAQVGKGEAELARALSAAAAQVADVEQLFPAPPGDPTGHQAFTAAHQAYDDLDVDAAKKKFEESLAFATKHPETADAHELAEIQAFLGGIALQNGGKNGAKQAQQELTRALILQPAYDFDPKFFGPDVKKVADKARAEINARPKGKLSISSEPQGAEVTLRGELAGTSPLDPQLLVSGRYLVGFRKPGYLPAGAFVDLGKDGAEAKVTLQPVPEYAKVRDQVAPFVAQFGNAKVPQAAREVAETMKSRFLVLASIGSTGAGDLEVWDAQDSGRLLGVKFDGSRGSWDDAATKVKAFMLNPSPAKQGKPVVAKVTEQPSGDSVLKKPWFWGVVGGVVVAGAVTAGVIVVANNSHTGFNPVLNF